MKLLLKLSCLLLICGLITACTPSSNTADESTKEYTSTYICPMHCEGSGSDSAGICPICEMDYVQNPKK